MPRPTLDGIKQASVGAFEKAKLMVNRAEEDEASEQSSQRSVLDEAADLICPDLTFQQRVIGFASCFALGYMITFMSFKFFIRLIEGNAVPFALNYTFGNLLALGSSWFLVGPKRQFRTMFDAKRRMSATIYLSCLVATLVVVFLPLPWAPQLALLVCLLVTQCLSNFWYSLSYVPYGRATVLRFVKRYTGMDEQPIEGNSV